MENNQPEIIDVKSKNDKKIMLFMLFVCIASAIELVFQFFKFDIIRLLHAALGVAAFAMFITKKTFINLLRGLVLQLPVITKSNIDKSSGMGYTETWWDLSLGKNFDYSFGFGFWVDNVSLNIDILTLLVLILFNWLIKKAEAEELA